MRLGVSYFLLFAVYGIVNTYLPVLLKNIGYTSGKVGILLGIYETAGLLLPLFLSTLTDKKGKYGLAMIILGGIMAAGLLPFAYQLPFYAAAASLCIFALGIRSLVPITDTFTSKSLGGDKKNYGKIRAIGSAGFVFINLCLQFTSIINSENTLSIILGICLTASLYIISLFFIPNIFVPVYAESQNSKQNIIKLFSFKEKNSEESFPPSFWFGLFIMAFGFLGLTPSQKFFSLYAKEYLHLNSYAGLWAISALAEIPVMFLSGKLIGKFGAERLIPIALVSISIRNIIYAAFPSIGGAVAAQLMHSLNFGLFHPVGIVFCASRVPKKAASLGMTLYSVAASGLSYITGSILGGYIIQLLGYIPMFIIFSIFPVIGTLLYFILGKKILR